MKSLRSLSSLLNRLLAFPSVDCCESGEGFGGARATRDELGAGAGAVVEEVLVATGLEIVVPDLEEEDPLVDVEFDEDDLREFVTGVEEALLAEVAEEGAPLTEPDLEDG